MNDFVALRDVRRGARLREALARVTREIGRAPASLMHVCGSHEQAIARYGLRSGFPRASSRSMKTSAIHWTCCRRRN